MYVCMCMYVRLCVCVCMYVCVFIYVCMYVCMYVCVYTHTYIHTYPATGLNSFTSAHLSSLFILFLKVQSPHLLGSPFYNVILITLFCNIS